MSGAHEVLARVAIFRIIATPHMAAGAAEAQVHPGISGSQAFHTARARWRYHSHAAQMFAGVMRSGHFVLSRDVVRTNI
jgi:hypothetical protein